MLKKKFDHNNNITTSAVAAAYSRRRGFNAIKFSLISAAATLQLLFYATSTRQQLQQVT